MSILSYPVYIGFIIIIHELEIFTGPLLKQVIFTWHTHMDRANSNHWTNDGHFECTIFGIGMRSKLCKLCILVSSGLAVNAPNSGYSISWIKIVNFIVTGRCRVAFQFASCRRSGSGGASSRQCRSTDQVQSHGCADSLRRAALRWGEGRG